MDVVFYSALADVAITAVICATILWRLQYFQLLDFTHKMLLTIVWLLFGYAFAISVPTVIDRSLSLYLLEKLDQRGGGIKLDAMQSVINSEFMREYRVLDARLTEQIESGTIRIERDCILLTEHGRRIAAASRFVRTNFLPRHRQLRGNYSDALVYPIGSETTLAGYSCNNPPQLTDESADAGE